MAHLSMHPHLGAAHAFGDFGREWVERAELKQLMERPFLFSSQRWQHGCIQLSETPTFNSCIQLSETPTFNGHMAGCPLKFV